MQTFVRIVRIPPRPYPLPGGDADIVRAGVIVGAQGRVCAVEDELGELVAAVDGARDAVVGRWRGADAADGGVAGLDARAEEPVIAFDGDAAGAATCSKPAPGVRATDEVRERCGLGRRR